MITIKGVVSSFVEAKCVSLLLCQRIDIPHGLCLAHISISSITRSDQVPEIVLIALLYHKSSLFASYDTDAYSQT